jgi:hypothetical protein
MIPNERTPASEKKDVAVKMVCSVPDMVSGQEKELVVPLLLNKYT